MTRVLVAHASKRGGTAGLAEMIADALRQQGMTVDVQPARAVHDIAGYDTVVLGGALYNEPVAPRRATVRTPASSGTA